MSSSTCGTTRPTLRIESGYLDFNVILEKSGALTSLLKLDLAPIRGLFIDDELVAELIEHLLYVLVSGHKFKGLFLASHRTLTRAHWLSTRTEFGM